MVIVLDSNVREKLTMHDRVGAQSTMASGGTGDEGQILQRAAKTFGCALDEKQAAKMLHFRTLLLDWNARVNLTSITEPRAVLERHLLDSLSCLLACNATMLASHARLLDVGSGAGIPGLILAIARPNWQIVTLEATAKKVKFQETVITELGLTNAVAVQGRAEEVARESGWRGAYDIVTARALAALPTLLEWCQPFVNIGGMTVAPKKGDNLGDELTQGQRAAKLLGGAPIESIPLPITLIAFAPDLADGRVIMRIRQKALSAPLYPRLGAASTKTPLGA